MKTNSNMIKNSFKVLLLAVFLGLMFVEPSMAAWEGKFTTFITNIQTALKGVAIAAITIALMFAGFQIAFNGKSLMAVMPAVLGGLVVGAAATFAADVIGA